MKGSKNLDDEIERLKRELRDARRAVRIVKRGEWMHSCDWADQEQRAAMWKEVAKLSRCKV